MPSPPPVTSSKATSLDSAQGPLPALTEVADEIRWTLAERKGWLVGFGLNLMVALAYVGYTHYQPGRPDDLRVAGIATGVAVWILADVINTNQLGDDADRVAASLGEGRGLVRQLALKNAALVVLLLPLTVAISIGVRVYLDRWRSIPHAVLLDLFVVFLWLGIGDILSVVLPYRPIPLRERWHRRRSWPRWALCLAAPYLAVLTVWYVRWPADRLAHHLVGTPRGHLLGYGFVYLCWGAFLWGFGLAFVAVYVALARDRLLAHLRRSD